MCAFVYLLLECRSPRAEKRLDVIFVHDATTSTGGPRVPLCSAAILLYRKTDQTEEVSEVTNSSKCV